ncbi:hypothetical protein ACUXIW_004967 [Ralstonia pickettii]|jgi:hypothetical protein|uniref:Uncharacterized protein n=3 Tax=Ralstonia TaxID=48736 RepID=A0ABM9L5S7_9RALS|nr:hypothetical protein [Ralstonia sp. GP73]CAJ0695962.1 hypothetical protein R77591_04507 [Ralstonia mannitolilytica]CAJ0733116.1 hypothetical protein R38712_05173 [Ralstonia pickettii]CAJ0902956.1 hypothetical protein R77564_04823 [Ralstonia sp. LMG 32965]
MARKPLEPTWRAILHRVATDRAELWRRIGPQVGRVDGFTRNLGAPKQ